MGWRGGVGQVELPVTLACVRVVGPGIWPDDSTGTPAALA